MEIKFWGVRGSIPTPISTEQIKEKLLYLAKRKINNKLIENQNIKEFLKKLSPLDFGAIGGNTSCIEINVNGDTLILDMGSGMKLLGQFIEKHRDQYSHVFHIFLSHTHWDHISGLPFFKPAHKQRCHLNFYSPLENLKMRLEYQQDHRFFPVGFELLKAKKTFYQLTNRTLILGDTKITHFLTNHPGTSYAYKIEHDRKKVIYMTDLYIDKPDDGMIEFCNNADLLIFDSQFSASEIKKKRDYGHCTCETGVDLAILANVKQIALFHHDPDKTDIQIQNNYKKVVKYHHEIYSGKPLKIILAYEGLQIKI
jgi:phosphoribosyl 1,2-cyclic phosphodiesterase